MSSNNQGFTLIQLAIALVIIGLLAAGILTGSAMIRSAGLQNIVTEVDAFQNAMKLFKEKYNDLPGDFANAESYWGTDPGGCPSPATGLPATPYIATHGIPTCNGNGNGDIGDFDTDGGITNYEWYRAWQHLADAGMIVDTFNGISGAGSTTNSLLDINVPSSRLSSSGYTLYHIATVNVTNNANYFQGIYGNVLTLGEPVTNSYTTGPAITASEAFLIDSKMDDGFPQYGKVVTFKTTVNPNCVTSNSATAATYNTTFTDIACSLIFITGY